MTKDEQIERLTKAVEELAKEIGRHPTTLPVPCPYPVYPVYPRPNWRWYEPVWTPTTITCTSTTTPTA